MLAFCESKKSFENTLSGGIRNSLEILNRLLNFVTEQKKKYEYRLAPQSNFYQRHLMVKDFLAIQKRRTPGQTCRHLALSVAATFNRRQTTARNIIRWERSWVEKKKIPESLYGGWYAEWMDNENLKMAI